MMRRWTGGAQPSPGLEIGRAPELIGEVRRAVHYSLVTMLFLQSFQSDAVWQGTAITHHSTCVIALL